MTPKEKSEELFGIYLIYTGNQTLAKKCALIAVEEMLNEYPIQVPKDSYEMERHLYWQEVKKELEKL